MSPAAKQYILIVDDDPSVRKTLALVLASEGYEVSTAENGLDALMQFRTRVPHLLLCDLEMPFMSGPELLSVVRRRFPEIGVIAMSSVYENEVVPVGVAADAFYGKGINKPPKLFRIVADVIRTSASQVSAHKELAPVWAPRIDKDENETPSALVTCPECLRSFSLVALPVGATVRETNCVFCLSDIRYIVGSPVSVPPSTNALDNITHINARAARFGTYEGRMRAAAKGR